MPRPTSSASSPRSPRRNAAARHLARCALVAVALLLPLDRAHATGGEDVDDYTSFFDPQIIARPDEAPFFLSGHTLYPWEILDETTALPDIDAVNLKEWSAYLRGKVSDASLDALVYKMKLGELDKLIWALEGKPQNLSKATAALKAQLDAVGSPAQVLQALYYLGFAKRCEPIAQRRAAEDSWDQQKQAETAARDLETASKLLAASETQMAGVKDPFLTERYRFQRLRLMFYTGRYADAERYYAASADAFKTESSIKYRFLSLAAGALYRQKQYARANYLYAQVFGRFPPLKRSAYLSFHPVEEADWQGCLAQARSDRERAVLWQLLGIYVDGPAAIERIYALAPGSDLLPLLLVREVNKAERDWSENNGRRNQGARGVRSDADAVGRKRLALLKRIADERKTFKPYLWQLATGHLYALTGDTKSALAYFDLAAATLGPAQPNQKDPRAADQLRMSRLFTRIQAQKTADKALEPELAAEITWLELSKNLHAPALKGWVLSALSQLYYRAGDSIRGVLLVNDLNTDIYLSNRRIDELTAFLARPAKSAFDAYLTARYGHTQAQLAEVKAINDLYAGRFKSAVSLYAKAGAQIADEKLSADPFVIHIVDCHDCDFEAKGAGTYTKATFAAKLLELSTQAERTGTDAAQASFQLASGIYNMSYYGNARDVYGTTANGNFQGPQPFNLNMQLAEKYYKRAMDLATDKEFKAKACFMAAKTEQNRYYNTHDGARGEGEGARGPKKKKEPVHSPVYFKLLKDTYADTRYYQEIVRECAYFRNFLKR